MNLVFESNESFRFLDYQISHKQLLIRGENAADGQNNIDLIFDGTEIVNCPTGFIGVKIYQLNTEEIENRNIENQYTHRVFLIITEGQEYYIKTGLLRIYKNSLTLNESSIDMTGNGQENLIWMSKN